VINLGSNTNTKRLVGYFPAGASKLNYSVADIPTDRLTHAIYAFAGISTTGECISDSPADDRVNFRNCLSSSNSIHTFEVLAFHRWRVERIGLFPFSYESPVLLA
jgi:GH18 family chitinase